MSADQVAALRVLQDAVAEVGEKDTPASRPASCPSRRAGRRERFYKRCKIGAPQDTKKHAFRRASDGLQLAGKVAADAGRGVARVSAVSVVRAGTKREQTGHVPTSSAVPGNGTDGTHPFRGVPVVPMDPAGPDELEGAGGGRLAGVWAA